MDNFRRILDVFENEKIKYGIEEVSDGKKIVKIIYVSKKNLTQEQIVSFKKYGFFNTPSLPYVYTVFNYGDMLSDSSDKLLKKVRDAYVKIEEITK